ncbi:kinase binding protein CGI-121-domain-containing protein [Xylogone sp. PMI_703]|nr:kinase binding protein CGI-121-domain-containing protein [Xylogone sp. PMI_703]
MAGLIESFNLEHVPLSHTIHIALFRDVKNSAFLHQQLLAGNSDFEYSFLDASLILSRLHILSAAYRAVNDLLENRLRTRNVHSEIVFSLSPNNNIAESFRRFGVQATTQNLLVMKVSTPARPVTAEMVQAHLNQAIEGEQITFGDGNLSDMTDIARVKKVYKLNTVSSVNGDALKKAVANGDGKGKDWRGELEVLLLGAMALRGVS